MSNVSRASEVEEEIPQIQEISDSEQEGEFASSSSSNGRNEDSPQLGGSQSIQGRPSIFHIGSPPIVPPRHKPDISVTVEVPMGIAKLRTPLRTDLSLFRGENPVITKPNRKRAGTGLNLNSGNQEEPQLQPHRPVSTNQGGGKSEEVATDLRLEISSASRRQQLPAYQRQRSQIAPQAINVEFVIRADGPNLVAVPVSAQGLQSASFNAVPGVQPIPLNIGAGSTSFPALYVNHQNVGRVTWQDNNYFPSSTNLRLSNPQNRGGENTSAGQNPRPRPIINSVYDPIYEQMGLPIDPHLRMFLARRNSGNGN